MDKARSIFLLPRFLLSLLLLVSAPSAFSAELTRDDSELATQRATAFVTAFANGDADAYVALLHTSIFQLVPNREQLIYGLKKGMESLRTSGQVVEKTELTPPTQFYSAGDEMVAFIVRKTTIREKEDRALFNGYLVAVRKTSGPGQWLFLDSDGFRNDPTLIFRMLPALPKDAVIPPISTQPVETKASSVESPPRAVSSVG
jgi:hypothetical protein